MHISNKTNNNEYIKRTVVDNKMKEVKEKNRVNNIFQLSLQILRRRIADKTNISDANMSKANAWYVVERRDAKQTPPKMAALRETGVLTMAALAP